MRKYVQIKINGIDQGCTPVELGENLPAHCNGLPGVWYPCDAFYTMVENWQFDAGMFETGDEMAAQVEEYVFYHLNEGGEETAIHEFDHVSAENNFFGSLEIDSIFWQLLDETEVDKMYGIPGKNADPGKNEAAPESLRAGEILQGMGYTLDYSDNIPMGISKPGGGTWGGSNEFDGLTPLVKTLALHWYSNESLYPVAALDICIAGRRVKVTQDDARAFTVALDDETETGLDYLEAKSATGDAIFEALRASGKITKNIEY